MSFTLFRLLVPELIFIETASGAGVAVGTGAGSVPSGLLFGEDLLVLLPHALDSHLPHILVAADLRLREFPVLPEYDVEAHSDHSDPEDDYRGENCLHLLEYEFRADRLVVVNLADDRREGLSHRDYLYLACVGSFLERNGVGDEHFLQAGVVDPVVSRT